MTRAAISILALWIALLIFPSSANAVLGLSVGGGFIPDGSRPGGLVQGHIGPITPFAEFFKKSGGATTVNLGVNLILDKTSVSVIHPYGGFGAGISRSSGGGSSKARPMVNAVTGMNLKLSDAAGLFLQVKYLYSFGSSFALPISGSGSGLSNLVVREFIIQGGLKFNIGP